MTYLLLTALAAVVILIAWIMGGDDDYPEPT
jgi:hypothetical protein